MFINIQNKIFAYLTVKKYIKEEKKWLCKCICGKTRKVKSHHLKRGDTISCGCIRRPRSLKIFTDLDIRKAALNKVLTGYKRSAKEKNIAFELTKEQFYEIVSLACYYCEVSGNNKARFRDEIIYYNGIDRVDNRKGYLITNCVPCCRNCNFNKKDVSKAIIFKAYNFLFNFEEYDQIFITNPRREKECD